MTCHGPSAQQFLKVQHHPGWPTFWLSGLPLLTLLFPALRYYRIAPATSAGNLLRMSRCGLHTTGIGKQCLNTRQHASVRVRPCLHPRACWLPYRHAQHGQTSTTCIVTACPADRSLASCTTQATKGRHAPAFTCLPGPFWLWVNFQGLTVVALKLPCLQARHGVVC